MHESRLRQLNDLLPLIKANAAKCHADADDADALVRSIKAAIAEERAADRETQRRRHGLRIVAIPALVGVGVEVARWWFGSQVRVAATSSALAATVTAAIAYAQLTPSIHHQPGPRPRPPVAGAPSHPPSHHAKTPDPPAVPADVTPTPLPERQRPKATLPSGTIPPLPLSSRTPAPPVAVPTTAVPVMDDPRCRLKVLPRKWQLVCRRLVR